MKQCTGYDLKLEGLSFRQFIAFYKTALEQEYEDLRRVAAMHGADLPPLHKDPETEEEKARLKDNDPLMDFPNDVIYLTSKQCDEQIKYYSGLKDRGIEIPSERIWDEKRKRACLGDDIVARRCSMNDKLWDLYQKNPRMNLPEVKKQIQIDILRSRLYPPNWSDYATPPPIDYIQKLKKSGKFTLIMDQLQELMRHGR